MKPQELNINCEVFDELRERLNTVINSLISAMIEKNLTTGSVGAKIGIELYKHTDEETGELLYLPEFKPDVSMKVGAKAKVECSKVTGMIMMQGQDRNYFVGSNQIDIEELLAEKEGA